ncbi:hypothetical protein BGZ76_006502 [Entomortierella beljakovae]|nr:hypothetical protein BGZ76_006502 [Entomortierella beljakovae]
MLATRSNLAAFESGSVKTLERKYSHLEHLLKPLSTDTPHYLDLGNGRNARINLIPAHHCPGAVMFLIQDDRSSILYTGDARNELLDLQALSNWPVFSPSAQRIDRLYLDTTYCHQEFLEIPSRRPRLAHYYIDTWTFGYEDIWIALSKAFRSKIHVTTYLYELYEAIDDLISPKILPHLTADGTAARFHSCRLGSTCRYGGVGENATSRELIRIQPNVFWFSSMMTERRRQQDTKCAANSRNAIQGDSHSFKTKEKLPPSIGKRDDLCYYINYGFHASLSELRQLVEIVSPKTIFPCVLHRDPIFHTFYKSNHESIALLAQNIPERSFSLEVEEDNERRPCFSDAISTDFQSFHNAKGFNVLDMNDRVLGITAVSDRPDPTHGKRPDYIILDERESYIAPTRPGHTVLTALSPRSKHLQKRMEKLKRQLRKTVSLEEQADGANLKEDEESILEEGPLSLDLQDIEKKRRWWLEFERGKSTTQEEDTTNEEVTDPHISRISSGGIVVDFAKDDERSVLLQQHDKEFGHERSPRIEEEEKDEDKWHDMSTIELNGPVLIDQCQSDTEPDANESTSLSKRYLSSSPDPICFSETPTGDLGINFSSSIPSPALSIFSAISQHSTSLDSIVKNTQSSNPSLPSPPAQLNQSQDYISIPSETSIKLSLTQSQHHPTLSQSTSPKTSTRTEDTMINPGKSSITSSSYRHGSFGKGMSVTYSNHRPSNNIFVQLAWSPPLKPIRKPTRISSEILLDQGQRSSSQLPIVPMTKRAASTIVVDEKRKEIIVIESSEDEEGDENRAVDYREPKKLKGIEVKDEALQKYTSGSKSGS